MVLVNNKFYFSSSSTYLNDFHYTVQSKDLVHYIPNLYKNLKKLSLPLLTITPTR